jgi:hypothetical protein
MSPNDTGFPTEPSPSAAELAEAMRAGFEARRALPARALLGTATGALLPDIDPKVRYYARLADHPAVARPGRFAALIRGLRRGLLVLLRPWLEIQTRFNFLLLEVDDGLRAKINETNVRLDHLRAQTEQLNAALEQCLLRLEGRPVPTPADRAENA